MLTVKWWQVRTKMKDCGPVAETKSKSYVKCNRYWGRQGEVGSEDSPADIHLQGRNMKPELKMLESLQWGSEEDHIGVNESCKEEKH